MDPQPHNKSGNSLTATDLIVIRYALIQVPVCLKAVTVTKSPRHTITTTFCLRSQENEDTPDRLSSYATSWLPTGACGKSCPLAISSLNEIEGELCVDFYLGCNRTFDTFLVHFSFGKKLYDSCSTTHWFVCGNSWRLCRYIFPLRILKQNDIPGWFHSGPQGCRTPEQIVIFQIENEEE